MSIVYDYPKSSCDCYNCTHHTYPVQGGFPTNLSVRNCKVSPGYDCLYRRAFKSEIQPQEGKNFQILNPEAMEDKYSQEFARYNCPEDKGCTEVYASPDPRLIDVPRSLVTTLDQPPIDSDVRLNQVYDDKLYRYGQDYRTYKDIEAGQVTYYVDNSIKDAFFEPVFSKSAEMFAYMYQDPMGAMKPQYDRYPLACPNHLNTKNSNYYGGLSWISDSQEQRQDLMARQMRKHNEQRWEPRWT